MKKIRDQHSIKKIYQKTINNRYKKASLAVEYVLSQELERDPDADFLWEKAPPILQYLPLIVEYGKNFSFLGDVNPQDIFREWSGLHLSKYKIYQHLPSKYIPETILCHPQKGFRALKKEVQRSTISFPCIAKPDGGARSIGVEMINSFSELEAYWSRFREDDFLVQAFVDDIHEYGLFCMWDFDKKKYSITSFSEKKFFSVVGDGKTTFSALIDTVETLSNDQKENIKEAFEMTDLQSIPSAGEERSLCRFATIRLGTVFRSRILSEQERQKLESLAQKLLVGFSGFYVGRFDLKAKNFEALLDGRCTVLELNGVIAVPQHIEDADLPVWEKYCEFQKHMETLQNIAEKNRKKQNKTPRTGWDFLRDFYRYSRRTKSFESGGLRMDQLWNSVRVLLQASGFVLRQEIRALFKKIRSAEES